MYRIGEEELAELRLVIASGKLCRLGDPAQGHLQEVMRFEREWAEMIGVNYALLLSGGGTAALVCALAALGIGPGDQVIVPAYTWMATATAVLSVGAIPVIAEIDETLTLDPRDVEAKLTSHTRAIIPVHMAGRPANLDALSELAQRHGLRIVEDCAQACGGSYHGRRLGSYGEASAFSFNDFKIMSCGEGGAMVTSDRTLFDRAVIYHDSLSTFPTFAPDLTVPTFIGQQFRASEIMGAILRIQRQRLDGILSDLRRIRQRFHTELGEEQKVRFAPDNDNAGDCGVWVAFQFKDEARARTFAQSEGVTGMLPIDTGRHVYSNWEVLLKKRVGHHPDMNPFNHPRNREFEVLYSGTMCPRTTEILSRTVYVRINPDWNEETVALKIAACEKAA